MMTSFRNQIGLFLAVLPIACNCEPTPRASTPPTGPATEAQGSRSQAVSRTLPEAPTAPSVTTVSVLRPIGFAQVPVLPDAPARQVNKRGFEKYRSGNIEEALAAFQQAHERSSDYDLARYNAACMLSLLGRYDESVHELEALLQRDLSRFLPRLENDQDLKSLRGTAAGKNLVERARALKRDWLLSAKHGVPTIAWVPHSIDRNQVMPEPAHSRAEWLRAGVWLHDSSRFLPLAPTAEHAQTAWIEPHTARVTMLLARVEPCLYDMCPRLHEAGVQLVQQLAASGPPLLLPEQQQHIGHTLGVEVTASGARMVLNGEHGTGWFETRDGKLRRAAEQHWLTGTQLSVTPLGTRLHSLPAGYRRATNALLGPHGTRLVLTPRHQGAELQFVLDPKTRRGVLVSVWAGCECETKEAAILRHAVDLVDLERQRLTPWFEGPGSAFARIGPDGAVYLQRGNQVERFATATSNSPGETLPKGIVLSPPLVEDENCCGL